MLAAIGAPELIWPVVIIVVILGARKLPEIGKGLGQGIKEFKSATKKADEEETPPAPPAPPATPPQPPTS